MRFRFTPLPTHDLRLAAVVNLYAPCPMLHASSLSSPCDLRLATYGLSATCGIKHFYLDFLLFPEYLKNKKGTEFPTAPD